MYKNFISAITWNSINTVFYKTILSVHQIVLFYFIPKELYGISGTLFAALYLLIGCTNFGFEYHLFTFFSYYSKSKQNFFHLIYQVSFKLVSIIVVIAIIYFIFHIFHYPLPSNVILYLVILFAVESIRKYVETVAQLAFLNKNITIIQIAMISAYVATIWTTFAQCGQITLNTLFVPLIIVSSIETALITVFIYQYYQTLPSQPYATTTAISMSKKSLLKEQLYSYINQLSKNIFSPNFLMVLIAIHVTMQQTGIIRFYTNIITLLYMLFNKSVAIPSGALFSSMTQENFQKTKQIFLKITNIYIQLLYTLAVITIATILPHMIINGCQSTTTYLSLWFITAGFIEYITITYEKLYIVQQKTHQLAIINVSSAILFIITLYGTPLNISMLLVPVCIIRAITAYAIGWYAYKKWNILPSITISVKAFTTGIFIAAILNYIIQMGCTIA